MKTEKLKNGKQNPTSHVALHTSQKGITLIALIITIIVMLILVGVTVTVALNGGLFNSAQDATAQTESEKQKEQTLADGRIEVGDIWYDSIEKYEQKIPSSNQEWVTTYTDAESYQAYAESLGFTVLTMDEYNSSYSGYTEPDEYGSTRFENYPGDFTYEKIALPYEVTGENSDYKIYKHPTITDVLIPNTMTSIGRSMLSECPELKRVYIPGSVKEIGGFAMSWCQKLDTVIFEETFSECVINDSFVFDSPWFYSNMTFDEETWEYTFTINGETYTIGACFVEGTKVLTPSGLVNIEDVNVGDKVISKNHETGEIEEKEVLKVAKHEIQYNTLKIYVADTQVEVTPNHKIYVKGVGYTEAGNLKVGDVLVNSNNVELPIEKIEEVENTGTKNVYNFVVEDNHNYFVGIDSILVHNKCFVAGSKVLTVNGLVNIEDVKVGDYVIAYNQETGMNEVRKVTGTFIHEKVQDQVTIEFIDESKVVMNMYHPLYTEEGWKSLSNYNGYETLKVGDKVKTEEGYKEITEIKVDLSSSPVDMYTISVEGLDNFYVNGTLAHDNEY